MTDKDPKDMTVSEQLRWAANGEPYNGIDENIWTYPTGKIKALEEAVTGEWPSDNEIFSIVADKIDAELAQARELSLLRGAELWAKANGWPDFKDGEDFGAWLDRCAIPRPRFEDGEPVQIGDKAEHPTTGETCTIDCINTFDDSYCIGFSGKPSESLLNGVRLKRPAPEALGADGKPIVEGETVWLDEAHSRCAGSYGFEDGNKYSLCGIERQEMLTVEDAHIEVDGREYVRVCTCGAWCHASWLTHTPPETQERIDDDATMPPAEYCAVRGIDIGDDPDRATATEAMVLDLLRRQRELDKRTGGDA